MRNQILGPVADVDSVMAICSARFLANGLLVLVVSVTLLTVQKLVNLDQQRSRHFESQHRQPNTETRPAKRGRCIPFL